MPDTAKQRNDLPTQLKGWLFAVVGLGMIVGAAAGAVSMHQFVRTAAAAPGVVTRLNHGGSHPEISFTAASGAIIDYPQGGMIWGYHTGEKVTVLYDSQHPGANPTLNTFGALWLNWVLLSGLGTVFVAAGLSLAFGGKP